MALGALPGSAWAQREREWRVLALGTASSEPFAGAGASLTVRGRTRVGASLAAAAGERSGRIAGRAEALLSFSLDPLRQHGLAPYAAGGLAVVGDRLGTQEYLVALVGLAANPGRPRGWFVEAGVGGGVRVGVGLAFRRLAR